MSEAFKLDQQRTFRRKVTFNIPADTGGYQQFCVDVEYKSRSKSQLLDMQQQDDADALREVIAGITGVESADGALSPRDAIEPMLEVPAFVYEAAMTFYDAMSGGNLRRTTPGRRRATG